MRGALVLVLVGLLGVPAVPAAADEGPWRWPLAGPHEVVRGFDPPSSRYGAGHRGVDLPASPGTPVRASAAGRVTYAGQLAGRGVLVVTHGGLRTTYEPVTATVPLGAVVAPGEVVGQVQAGHAGCPVAACLHWGLRRGEEYLDPVRLVERGPVRLLPLEGAGAAPPSGAGATRGSAGAPPAAADAVGTARLAPGAPVEEPSWSLRAAETPLGAAAVVALVLGIALLARPRPAPPDPVSGGVALRLAAPSEEGPGPAATLLDLEAARLRRHAS